LLEIVPIVDAIEVYNSRCWLPTFNTQARRFAELHGVAGTAGSDAHAAFEVGRAMMWLEQFANAAELRTALRSARLVTRWSPPWFHLVSRYAVYAKRLRARHVVP
jgi:predicted metal-dependent phosphoesterase TrpH